MPETLESITVSDCRPIKPQWLDGRMHQCLIKSKKGWIGNDSEIIQIDEEKCNGCGACADACHEGAIGMVNGKAKLLRDDYCDGLGDCLPTCPTGAISFVEREAAAYDERLCKSICRKRTHKRYLSRFSYRMPRSRMQQFKRQETASPIPAQVNSQLGQCPARSN